MGYKDFLDLKNKKGQSMLEYILLMAVMTTIGMTLFKSKVFTDFMGPNSVFFDELRSRYAFTYRYGSPPTGNEDPTEGNSYSNKHEAYFNGSTNETRFFTPVDTYP
jgi:hypothetical protein